MSYFDERDLNYMVKSAQHNAWTRKGRVSEELRLLLLTEIAVAMCTGALVAILRVSLSRACYLTN
jgi:hypothetical protein